MGVNARQAATDALFDIEKKGEYSTKAVTEAIKKLEPIDKAFANELILGVLRNKIYLDFIIQSFSKTKLKKLNPYVLQILRTGAYQMVCIDKIPVSAACNEAVKLAEKRARAAKGFVNGVLRSISRSLDSLPVPTGDMCEVMSVKYSCPLWLTRKLYNQFGEEECREILKDSLKPHPTTIRVNSLKTNEDELIEKLLKEGVNAERSSVKNCLIIKGAINVNASDAYKDGLYTLQNINSQEASLALGPKCGETVIDMCAAPGGKTTHLAELMKNQGRVIAFDIHPHKIELINKTAERLGLDCIEAKCHNSEEIIEEYREIGDRVLADVPCSGIGVIHRKPDIKYNRQETDIPALCDIQKKILENAAEYVKPGGVLVYSTCTILEEENNGITDEFLKEHKDFKKDFEKLYLAHKTGGSGFYICKMERKK